MSPYEEEIYHNAIEEALAWYFENAYGEACSEVLERGKIAFDQASAVDWDSLHPKCECRVCNKQNPAEYLVSWKVCACYPDKTAFACDPCATTERLCDCGAEGYHTIEATL